MKAKLYSSQTFTGGDQGLAHCTAAGFVVLTSPDGGNIIDLIRSQQHESDLIDQIVAEVSTAELASFSMLFTAGGDLYLIAAGDASVSVQSEATQLSVQAAPGQVLVHAINAGINETDATITMRNAAASTTDRPSDPLTEGTVAASHIEIAIGEQAVDPLVMIDEPAFELAEEPEATFDEVAFELDEEPIASIAEPVAAAPKPIPAPAAAAAAAAAAAVIPPAPAATPPTPEPAAPAAPTPVGQAMVLGIACPQGHHNHPDAVYCSQCGTKMGVHHTTVLLNGPRPPLGVLVVDDGTTYSLSEDLVIGREPTSHTDVVAGSATAMALIDESLSLSRQHARVHLDEWSVLVQDLGSANGTFLSRGDQPWARLEPQQSTPLEPGDRLRLGGRIVQIELHHIRA